MAMKETARMDLRYVAAKMAAKRRESNIPLRKITELTGVPHATLCRYEQGKCDTYSVVAAYRMALRSLTGVDISIIGQDGGRWK